MLLGMIVMGLVNIPILFLFPSFWLGLLYYLLIGLLGLAAYKWYNTLKFMLKKSKIDSLKFNELSNSRKKILTEIQGILPEALS